MTDGLTFEVFGNKGILDNLDNLDAQIREEAQSLLEQAGEMGKARAEELAPVSDIDTPGYVHMRDQMYVDVQPGVVTIGNDSDHAIFNELGTVHMPAHPFLTPAWVDAGEWLKEQLRGIV